MTTATRTAPTHGTRACYLRGCRRDECLTAHRRYMKAYHLDRGRNGNRRVDATPIMPKIRAYSEAGWSHHQMSQLSGCSKAVFQGLLAGTSANVNHKVYRLLQAMPATPPSVTSCKYIDATGTIRRARALIAIGHYVGECAAEIGIHPDHLGRILGGDMPVVLGATSVRVAALYDRWRWKPGKNLANRTIARKKGWHGPLAWDGNIDDPKAQPDTEKPAKGKAKTPARPAGRRQEVEHLAGFGLPEREIAARLDMAESTVRQFIQEWRTGTRRDRRKAA